MPGEKFWPPLGVVDWAEYLATVSSPRRLDAIRDASRLLILSTHRLFIVWQHASLGEVFDLEDVEPVGIAKPRGKMFKSGEVAIHTRVRANDGLREYEWATGKNEAEAFIAKLQEARQATPVREEPSQVASEKDVASQQGEVPAWIEDWLAESRQTWGRNDAWVWSQEVAVLVTGPMSFRALVADSLALPMAKVANVRGCAATEEFLMATQSPVDVVVVSPDMREPDILPMAEFIHRTYPATAVIVVRYEGDADVPVSRPGIHTIMTVDDGPVRLREAVRELVSRA